MNESDNPESRLHGLLVVLFYISLSLLALASALDILNGLDNFLHAPIGIKDNPPEPGIVVQLAQLTWIPLLLSVLLFGFLRMMSLIFKSVPLLLGTLIVTCGFTSLVGGILGEHKGKELFDGQTYFTQTVTPTLYVIFLMSWVGVGAYLFIEKWKRDRRLRHLLVGSCFILGIVFGLVSLIGGGMFNESPFTYLMFYGFSSP